MKQTELTLARPTSMANRGVHWENLLRVAFSRLPQCTVLKVGAPVHVIRWHRKSKTGRGGEFIGYFETRGVADFEGGYNGRPVSIEAKETQTPNRWNIKAAVKDHQLQRMCDTYEIGGLAGILLRWRPAGMPGADFGISWPRLHDWVIAETKSLTLAALTDAASIKESGIIMLRSDFFKADLQPMMDMLEGEA